MFSSALLFNIAHNRRRQFASCFAGVVCYDSTQRTHGCPYNEIPIHKT
jgi:hypothetical protein